MNFIQESSLILPRGEKQRVRAWVWRDTHDFCGAVGGLAAGLFAETLHRSVTQQETLLR